MKIRILYRTILRTDHGEKLDIYTSQIIDVRPV